ncbi:hypothetical protein LTR53_005676 [Teratosphaeriaceae sp. CCFEE 6253]|nr:hypothetical protein LTR53_005676 [Teratosphaeriaceae sp. CCFEE 6253]
MPRQSRGPSSSAPKRPAMAPARAPQPPAQTRQASTAAHPPARQAPGQTAPAQQQAGGSGMMGGFVSSMAGAVVGSTVGHAIGGMFGGGSSQEAAPAADASQPLAQTSDGGYAVNAAYQPPSMCEADVKSFRGCMDQNRGDLTICGWYLDQLKACQAQAKEY